jgi:hypothetical protein
MTGRFPFTKLAKYPHMKPEDIAVWERFLIASPRFFDTVDYDMAVGAGAPQNPEHPPEIQADGKILTQKKIDVVGYAGDRTTVVEVGPVADMRKLGQILTYFDLYTKDHPDTFPVAKMVVCGAVERELGDLYQRHDIILEVV